eukprot:21388-Heterococcus_DN1.PRE.1
MPYSTSRSANTAPRRAAAAGLQMSSTLTSLSEAREIMDIGKSFGRLAERYYVQRADGDNFISY